MERLAPTPWTQDRYGNVLDADGEKILMSGVSLPCGYHPEAFAQADAHAKLLTAAPDLLAALKEMVAAFNDPANDGGMRVLFAETQALDAIAKAEGGSDA
jgi:hypothetical protein